ncbi:MAG: hypothetical protein EA376_00560 [Phycisphaeraceae bacterium]|nr:MAG: hypothetical protein EA376_00560 [Phycisphaeraceae bacterium]
MNDNGAIELAESTRFRRTRFALAIVTAPIIPAIIGVVAVHILETRFNLEGDVRIMIVVLILSALGLISLFCIGTIIYHYYKMVLPRRVVALRYNPSSNTLETPFANGSARYSVESIEALHLRIARLFYSDRVGSDGGVVCQVFAIGDAVTVDAEIYLYGCYFDMLLVRPDANVENALRDFSSRIGMPLHVERRPGRLRTSWSVYNSIVCNLE